MDSSGSQPGSTSLDLAGKCWAAGHVATTAAHGAHALGTQFAGSGRASHLILPLLDGGLHHLDPIRLELDCKIRNIKQVGWLETLVAPVLMLEALLFTS